MPIDNGTFVTELIKKVEDGIGFVPFVGSGISQQSGIMIGSEISQYLSYVIFKIIQPYCCQTSSCQSSNKNQYKINGDRWNLAIAGWPRIPTQIEAARSTDWVADEYKSLLEKYRVNKSHSSQMDYLYIFSKNDGCFDIPPVAPKGISVYFDKSGNLQIENDKRGINDEDFKKINDVLSEIHLDRLLNTDTDPFHPKRGVSVTSKTYLKESAIRALHDWRLCLQFLARLRAHEGLLVLGEEIDQYVIDSFNIFMTKGRRPNLTHQMLAFLTRPLKIRTLISTNFDTLIEDAFREVDKPLRVISVEKHSQLPNPDSVTSRKTLLKIHGSLHETRADISLDAIPSAAEKDAFLRYIWPLERPYPSTLPSCLLVMGTTIPDKRTVALIKYACDVADDSFKVFVVAFDEATIKEIKHAFGSEYISDNSSKSNEDGNNSRFIFTITRRLDLLLFELYQTKCYSLPPAGFNYRINQYIPPFNPLDFLDRDKIVSCYKKATYSFYKSHIPSVNERDFFVKWKDGIEWSKKTNDGKEDSRNIILIEGEMFVTQIAAALFYLLEKEYKNCIWFELEDFKDTESILTELFEHISIQIGIRHVENINVSFDFCSVGDDESRIDEIKNRAKILCDHYGIITNNWYLFFYGRNIPTSCFGFGKDDIQESGNDSVDDRNKELFDYFYKPFWLALEALRRLGFNVIYLPRTKKQVRLKTELGNGVFKIIDDKYKEFFDDFNKISKICSNFYDSYYEIKKTTISHVIRNEHIVSRNEIESRLSDQIKAFVETIDEKSGDQASQTNRRRRFTYAATLFRQSRNVSSLVIEAFHAEILRYSKYVYISGQDKYQKKQNSNEGGNLNKYRFDLQKNNNDALEWRNKLASEKPQFFYRKPGGSVWMFGEQRLLANSLTRRLIADNSSGGLKKSRDQRDKKAIKHYWIGIWYLRAFYSSMDINPLRESLYHLFMCRRSINYYLNKDSEEISRFGFTLADRRLEILASCLYSIAKVMQIALNSYARWSRTYNRMMEFFFDAVSKELEFDESKYCSFVQECFFDGQHSKFGLSGEFSEKIKEWIIITIGLSECGNSNSVTAEDVECVASAILTIRRICKQLEREIIGAYDVYPNSERKFEVIHSQTLFSPVDRITFKPYIDYFPADSLAELLEYGSGFESNDFICKTKNVSLDYVSDMGGNIADNVDRVLELKKNISINLRNKPVLLYQYLVLLSEYVYLFVRQAKFERRRDCVARYLNIHCTESSLQKNNKLWELIGLLSQLGMELLHGLPPVFLEQEHALRVRLLAYSAMSLGRTGKFSEAHQNLNTATGIVFNLSGNESRMEAVILRIRRAEIHIYEARSLAAELSELLKTESEKGNAKSLEGESQSAIEKSQQSTEKSGSDASKKKAAEIVYYKHIMQLDDALSALDDAVELNNQCRVSSFWTSKIHCYRILIFAEHFTPYYFNSIGSAAQNKTMPELSSENYLASIRRRPRIYSDINSARSHLLEELERGILSCGNEVYRKFCFINIFIKAFRKYKFFCKYLGSKEALQSIDEFKNDSITLINKVIGSDCLLKSGNKIDANIMSKCFQQKTKNNDDALKDFLSNVCRMVELELLDLN